MSAFIILTASRIVDSEGGIRDIEIRVDPSAIITIERETLHAGQTLIPISRVNIAKSGLVISLQVRETPDVIESKVEAAMAIRKLITVKTHHINSSSAFLPKGD